NRKARSQRYAMASSKGGPSKMTPASRWMAITGLILLVFVPSHVWMFSLGPYYETVIDGVVMRDLYRLVVERFELEPVWWTQETGIREMSIKEVQACRERIDHTHLSFVPRPFVSCVRAANP